MSMTAMSRVSKSAPAVWAMLDRRVRTLCPASLAVSTISRPHSEGGGTENCELDVPWSVIELVYGGHATARDITKLRSLPLPNVLPGTKIAQKYST